MGNGNREKHVRIKVYRHLCWHPTRKSPNLDVVVCSHGIWDKPKH